MFEAILLRLGLSSDTVHAVVRWRGAVGGAERSAAAHWCAQRADATYAACLNGTIARTPQALFSSLSLPFVLVQRLCPIADQLRAFQVSEGAFFSPSACA